MRKVVEGGEKNWNIVAQKLGTERKADSVRQRWFLLNRGPIRANGIAKNTVKRDPLGRKSNTKNTKWIQNKMKSSVALRLNKVGQPHIFTGKGIRWEAKEESQLLQLVKSRDANPGGPRGPPGPLALAIP
jgi:hypothetical protein